MYILSLTVQDPDSLPEVEIGVKNHCHLNHPVVALVEKKKVAVGMAVVETNAVTEIAEMTVKVDAVISNAKSNKNSRDFEGKGNKRPHRTSNEKKNGFVIRNKGDK